MNVLLILDIQVGLVHGPESHGAAKSCWRQ